jgi:hypothetical protein
MAVMEIPKSARQPIQHLIRLSAADFKSLLDALERATPVLDEDNFWRHVVPHLPTIDPSVVKSIVSEIVEMATSVSTMNTGIEEFASSVADGALAANSKDFPVTESDAKVLKERLVNALQGRKGLSITTKAMGVAVDQDRVFLHARILTDVRPVFDESGESVHGAVIVHNLRIHYGQDSDHKDFYVALDTSDIQDLREALDRADAKANTLKNLLKRSEVSYLDADE